MKYYCCYLLNDNGKVEMFIDFKYIIIYRDMLVVISVVMIGWVCLYFIYCILFLNIM